MKTVPKESQASSYATQSGTEKDSSAVIIHISTFETPTGQMPLRMQYIKVK